MKHLIKKEIIEYVKNYPERKQVENIWQPPIVGFADANRSYIRELKKMVLILQIFQ
jgi:hypothetical protein